MCNVGERRAGETKFELSLETVGNVREFLVRDCNGYVLKTKEIMKYFV